MEPIKVRSWAEYIYEHPDFTGCLSNSGNNIACYENGKRHREDGPAVEDLDGTKDWYLNGQLHRENGPAIVYEDGTKEW